MARAAETTRPGPDTAAPRYAGAAGWSAVALAALISSLFGALAGGETVAEGWMGIGHFIQMGLTIGAASLAIARPRAGSLFFLLGLLMAGFTLRTGEVFPLLFGAVLALTGVLFMVGRPRPQRRAYWITAGVPLLVTALTMLLMLLIGPPAAV